MSHFTVIVCVADAAGTPESVVKTATRMLAPYDENMEVEPYERPMGERNIAHMREWLEETKGITNAPLHVLLNHVRAYTNHPGAIDADGRLCEVVTYNPKSKWDFHTLGGRWDGEYAAEGETGDGYARNVRPLQAIVDAAERGEPPFALVLPNGDWMQRGEMGWFGMAADELPRDEWAQRVANALRPYVIGGAAVLFDCHI